MDFTVYCIQFSYIITYSNMSLTSVGSLSFTETIPFDHMIARDGYNRAPASHKIYGIYTVVQYII